MSSPFGNIPRTNRSDEMAWSVDRLYAGDLSCRIHMPPATQSRYEGGVEVVNGLARPAPQRLFLVDDFPGCPEDWARGDRLLNLVSAFMKVELGHMIWIDGTMNDEDPYHLAMRVSAMGMCALTGEKVSWPVKLEKYGNVCPKHGIRFQAERYCSRCQHVWPVQNFVSSLGGRLWRDGFFAEGGQTREFVITDNVLRSVAAHQIGDDRVNAIGVSLFRSREPKPVYRGFESLTFDTKGATRGGPELGAGALVHQEVRDDGHDVSFWNPNAVAHFIVYIVFEEQFREILASRSKSGGGGGRPTFLGKHRVGYP